jgi:hypothetical protein
VKELSDDGFLTRAEVYTAIASRKRRCAAGRARGRRRRSRTRRAFGSTPARKRNVLTAGDPWRRCQRHGRSFRMRGAPTVSLRRRSSIDSTAACTRSKSSRSCSSIPTSSKVSLRAGLACARHSCSARATSPSWEKSCGASSPTGATSSPRSRFLLTARARAVRNAREGDRRCVRSVLRGRSEPRSRALNEECARSERRSRRRGRAGPRSPPAARPQRVVNSIEKVALEDESWRATVSGPRRPRDFLPS